MTHFTEIIWLIIVFFFILLLLIVHRRSLKSLSDILLEERKHKIALLNYVLKDIESKRGELEAKTIEVEEFKTQCDALKKDIRILTDMPEKSKPRVLRRNDLRERDIDQETR